MLNALKETSAPTILVAASVMLILIALLQKNSNFLDVSSIFKTHFCVFSKSPLQFFVIFGVPALLAIAAAMTSTITEDIINNINVVLAVLMAMFFSLLSILCSFGKKSDITENSSVQSKRYTALLKDTFNAVMFECIVCIVLLVITFIQLFLDNYEASVTISIVSGIIYYLTFTLILNIFVIIKRVRVLFNKKDE